MADANAVALARRDVGTGLGLTIVRELVALHGGRIAVQSAKGFGTEFTLYFPALESS